MKHCPICAGSYATHFAVCPQDGARLVDLHEYEPGETIIGKYRIERKLGQGGMGSVYLAKHILLDRPRALKFISAELCNNPVALTRFRREALAATELTHPNIVKVHDLEQLDDGAPFISMAFIDGQELRQALNGGPFEVGRALSITRQIASGLAAAHAKDVLHRDIKPENILLQIEDGAEQAKLLDFGIAAYKRGSVAGLTHGLTLSPAYAAPEQWREMKSLQMDGRVDLYALGGVLYEMLTGRTCYEAENLEGWMFQHLQGQPEPPSRLRPELAEYPALDKLVLSMLAREREGRPANAKDLLALLEEAGQRAARRKAQPKFPAREKTRAETQFDPQPQPAPKILSKPEPGKPKSKKLRRWLAAAAIVAACGAALYLWQYWLARTRIQDEDARQAQINALISAQKSSDDAAGKKPSPAALYDLGKTAFDSKEYKQARSLFDQACQTGEMRGCNYQGFLWSQGLGGGRNQEKAAQLYLKACNGGVMTSCASLGSLFLDNDQKDDAKTYFKKACDGGLAEGCKLLEGVK